MADTIYRGYRIRPKPVKGFFGIIIRPDGVTLKEIARALHEDGVDGVIACAKRIIDADIVAAAAARAAKSKV